VCLADISPKNSFGTYTEALSAFLKQLCDSSGRACVFCGIRVKGGGRAIKQHAETHNNDRSHWVRCDECGRHCPGLLTLQTHLTGAHSGSRRYEGEYVIIVSIVFRTCKTRLPQRALQVSHMCICGVVKR
jgi:hypothetical protein